MNLDNVKLKRKDVASINLAEKKYHTLFEVHVFIRAKAFNVATILMDYVKEEKSHVELDFETIFQILNDISFAAMALESNIYNRIINLKKDSNNNIKERILLAIENYIIYYLEQIT